MRLYLHHEVKKGTYTYNNLKGGDSGQGVILNNVCSAIKNHKKVIASTSLCNLSFNTMEVVLFREFKNFVDIPYYYTPFATLRTLILCMSVCGCDKCIW